MREIKFRGKDITTGEWRYGCLVDNLWNYSELHSLHGLPVCEIIMSGECDDYESMQDAELNRTVDPKTVGQFTGLQDKNGKDIYEGDIVISGKGSAKYEICWGKVGFGGISKEGDDWGPYTLRLYINEGHPELTVIGNIYSNPELLTHAK